MIRVVCACGRVFKAEARHSGKRTRCPACGAGLVIGQAPASGSGERKLEEVPSWWYPATPTELVGADHAHPAGKPDPEVMPTVVLDPGAAPEGGDHAGRAGDGQRAAHPADEGRSLGNLSRAVAASAALALAALCWIWWSLPSIGDPPPGGARAVAAPRAPGPLTIPPGFGALLGGHGREERRPPGLTRRLRLLVPAYIYPAKDGLLQWRRLFDAAAKVDLVAVVNPASGPGAERNPDYAAVVAEAASRGVKLVGYVNTEYAARPASEIKSEVDSWVRFYPRIAGVFLDQQPTDPRHAAYIADIGAHARTKIKDGLVITNPGVPSDESYLARHASDLVCLFSQPAGFGDFELPANLREFDSSHYAALVYQVADAESMRSLLKDAIIKRIGWIYVTDGKMPNPWGRLPAYWEAEVDAVTRLH